MSKFAPISLERLFEKRHVAQIIRGEKEMDMIYKLAIDDLTKSIKLFESKRELAPTKYGSQLLRQKNMKKQLVKFRDTLNSNLSNQLNTQITDSWTLSNTKNDLLVSSFLKGTDISGATNYFNVNSKALENFLKRKTKGLNLSDKVWNLANDSQKLVEDWIGSGITQGKSTARMSSEMFRMMQDPNAAKVVTDTGETIRFSKVSDFLKTPASKGHYKNPRKAIKRLVRNEINKSYRLSDHTRINQLDFVVGKKVHLSAAHKDYDICDNLKGKYPKTFIFDGWHPNCLCFVTSILMTKEEFKNGTTTSQSKNYVKKIPVPTQRYVKTRGIKHKGSSWYDDNFKNNKPLKKVGGASKGITKYKNSREWDYDANPEGYLQNAKKDLVTKK